MTETKKLSHTNTTVHYQVVGNKSVIVAEFAALKDANALVQSVDICDSEWGTIETVGPGETVSGSFCIPEPLSVDGDLIDLISFFA